MLTASKTGKAIQYALNYEAGLRSFLEDGLVPMTNSLDERTIRPFTVGRKNWLFSTSTKGAEASAAVFSLIETAKSNKLNPYDYIESSWIIYLNKIWLKIQKDWTGSYHGVKR